MKTRKVLITSGGTQEYIDDVRIMTNISTGKLGAKIAEKACPFFEVYYVHGHNAIIPNANVLIPTNKISLFPVVSAQDAFTTIKKLMSENIFLAVVHSMAVSDFSFKRDQTVKCKSNNIKGFIEYIQRTIVDNPKIIKYIKEWNPKTLLVGFKFEVGLSPENLVNLAHLSIKNNKCDLVVVNDKKTIKQSNQHVAQFVFSDEMKNSLIQDNTIFGKDEIADAIITFLLSKVFQ